MQVPLLDLKEQLKPLRDDIVREVTKIIDSTGYILGPKVEEFENEVASYCQAKHGIGVSSGTDASSVTFDKTGPTAGNLTATGGDTIVDLDWSGAPAFTDPSGLDVSDTYVLRWSDVGFPSSFMKSNGQPLDFLVILESTAFMNSFGQ